VLRRLQAATGTAGSADVRAVMDWRGRGAVGMIGCSGSAEEGGVTEGKEVG
jgi:hypothetical protein